MAVRPIDGNELYRIEKLLDTDIVRQDKCMIARDLLQGLRRKSWIGWKRDCGRDRA